MPQRLAAALTAPPGQWSTMQKLMIRTGRGYRQTTRAEVAEAFGAMVLTEFNKVRPAARRRRR